MLKIKANDLAIGIHSMIKAFQSILYSLLGSSRETNVLPIFDPIKQFDTVRNDRVGVVQALNGAFLVVLSGRAHPFFYRAQDFLVQRSKTSQWAETAQFYLNGIEFVQEEIKNVCKTDSDFAERLRALSEYFSKRNALVDKNEAEERIWSVFFPEAMGIRQNEQECVKALRSKRTVKITKLNSSPISDPTREILFTSNVLLTIPPASKSLDELYLSAHLQKKLKAISQEKQIFWYDHPIQMGVAPKKNEVFFGLRGLEKTFAFERHCGNMPPDARPVCILSVSVTHNGLHAVAKTYLKEIFKNYEGLKNIDLYVFTEKDTRRIIKEILVPAALYYNTQQKTKDCFDVFGVDGEYGRHYNFLKAIAAVWSIFFQPKIRATIKIDLDQIFPQKELRKETGATAFEHLMSPLWGAKGLDSNGRPLEMGLIAGALVNKQDMGKSLFTPDVRFPDKILLPHEYIFYSPLPQALSTEAEMLTRYTDTAFDGKRKCIQRIHVTGGTNGILVDSLRRHRPFTPSFIGRAEDQAYILSVLFKKGQRLAYVHKDGFIMRHDKEAFAQEAIRSAYIGKLLGDYIRILYFSAYSKVLPGSVSEIKDIVDPFTGCFISKIPMSIVFLQFGLQAGSFFSQGKNEQGLEFVINGSRRIQEALDLTDGKKGVIKRQFQKERLSWDLFYDTLSAIEGGLKNGDCFARDLQKKALAIIYQCAIRP